MKLTSFLLNLCSWTGCWSTEWKDRRIGFSKLEDFDSILSDHGMRQFIQTGLNDDVVKSWRCGLRRDRWPNQQILSNLQQKAFQKVCAACSEPFDFFQ